MSKLFGRRRALCIVLFSCVSVGLSMPVTANPYAELWQAPSEVTLPAPSRSILLQRGVDIPSWLAQHNIEGATLLPMGKRQLVQFQADEQRWNQMQQTTCQSAFVAACETAVCQAIQLNAEVEGVQDANKVKARIVKKRTAVPAQGEIEQTETSCRTPMLLPPPDAASAAVHLDLSEVGDLVEALTSDRERSEAVTSATEDAIQQAVEETAEEAAGEAGEEAIEATAEKTVEQTAEVTSPETEGTDPTEPRSQLEVARSVQLPLQLAVNGGFGQPLTLGTEALPADTSQYDLVVGEGCQEVRIPLESIAPAHIPGVVLGLVDAAQVNDVASAYNLQVLEQTVLSSTNENLVLFGTADSILTVLGLLSADPRVVGAQREYVFMTSAESAYVVADSYSDEYAAFNYGPLATGARALHAQTRGASQTVAVIDTGIAQTHPELQGRLEQADFTGQGIADEAHGTAVAGIIAATANNGAGVYGVAPETKILGLKACHPVEEGGLAARCRSSALVKALDYAVQQNVSVINMSLAGPPDALLARYVAQAIAKNILVVAGAGNGGPSAKPAFPAALPEVIAVTAIDPSLRLYRQANQGDYIDLAAPGVDIVTVQPSGDYPATSGTSWAAAHVSGIAALLKDLVPLYGGSEIASLLSAHTRDLGDAGRDRQFGNGLVDACRAAATATADAVACERVAGDER